jgi:hypothetical protein
MFNLCLRFTGRQLRAARILAGLRRPPQHKLGGYIQRRSELRPAQQALAAKQVNRK